MTVQWECIACLLQGGDPEEKMFKLRPKEWVEVCWIKVMSGGDRPSQTEEASRPRSIAVPSFNHYWIPKDQWFSSLLWSPVTAHCLLLLSDKCSAHLRPPLCRWEDCTLYKKATLWRLVRVRIHPMLRVPSQPPWHTSASILRGPHDLSDSKVPYVWPETLSTHTRSTWPAHWGQECHNLIQ